jgi:hypothetical protein
MTNQNGIVLPSQAEIEGIYNSIEDSARQQYQPQSSQKISPRLWMIGLLAAGICGALLGSSDLKIDPTVTFDTKLGQRTQPYWLVPKGAKVVRTDAGAGAIKGLGWVVGSLAGAALLHVGGKDEQWQRFIGTIQSQWVENFFRHNQAKLELQSMAALQLEKQHLNTDIEVDLVEQRWQFNQAIGYDPVLAQSMQQPMNSLPYGAPGTYDDINRPGDKVEGENTQGLPRAEPSGKTKIEPIKRPDLSKVDLKLPPLTDYPAILVFGAPGGGKSTFGHEIVNKKLEAGHQVIVLDPHYKKDAWVGCEVFGKAFNYKEIDATIEWFAEEVEDRYRRLAEEDNPIFEPLSIVADEFTMWGKRCKNAGLFLWQCVTDIRKVNCFALIIGHTNTLTGLGGKDAAGAAKLIKDAVLEIEVIAKQDPDSGRAVPAFIAFVKLPGMARKDSFGVRIEEKTGDCQRVNADKTKSVLVADLPDELSEDLWEETDGTKKTEPCEPNENKGCNRRNLIETYEVSSVEPNPKPSEPLQAEGFSGSEKKYIGEKYSRTEAKLLVLNSLVQGNKTGTIETLWACHKGGSAAYQQARAEFEDLMSDEPETLA